MKKEEWKKQELEKRDREITRLKEMRDNILREKDAEVARLDQQILEAGYLAEAIEKLK